MSLFYQPGISGGTLHLEEDESRHCTRVLRRQSGDPIRLTDGHGFFYDAVIEDASPKRCTFRIIKMEKASPRPCFIHIALSPTKNIDRVEWFTEKATELGVDRISLMQCARTERSSIKTERLQRVAISAMKQSLKAFLPEIVSLRPFSDVVTSTTEDNRFIAFVDAGNPLHLKDTPIVGDRTSVVLIGPEGDFSPEELSVAVSSGFHKVSLGPARLRTETAALAACHILNLINT